MSGPAIPGAELGDLLRRLIRIDSCNPPGREAPVAELLGGWLREAGLEVELDRFAAGRANVVARWRGSGGAPALLFNGHLDTVPVEREQWRHDPHAAVVEGDVLHGRGTVDMKGGVAALAMACAALARAGSTPAARPDLRRHRRRGGGLLRLATAGRRRPGSGRRPGRGRAHQPAGGHGAQGSAVAQDRHQRPGRPRIDAGTGQQRDRRHVPDHREAAGVSARTPAASAAGTADRQPGDHRGRCEGQHRGRPVCADGGSPQRPGAGPRRPAARGARAGGHRGSRRDRC